MDEVGGCAQILLQVCILLGALESVGSALVAVFADESVDGLVFAEFLQGRGEDDQFRPVGKRHPGAVDRLVAQPGALEFLWIKIYDTLLYRLIHHNEIGLQREGGGLLEALEVVPDEKALQLHPAGLVVLCQNGLDEHYGQVFCEVRAGIFHHIPHRALCAAHDALHSVGCAQIMALVDAGAAAYAHEDVLGVVCHADDLVWNHLTYGKDKVEGRVQQQFVHLRRPVVVHLPFRNLLHIRSWHRAHGDDVVAPVVHPEKTFGSVPEHGPDLLGSHGGVGAQGGHHIRQGIPEVIVNHLCDGPGVGIEAGEVRRQREHPLLRPHRIENLFQRIAHLLGADAVVF